MGGLFSRAGTDTYYANYEKSFDKLERESGKVMARRVKRRKSMDACSKVGFWMQAVGLCVATLITAYLQRVSSQQWYQKSITILGAFAVPFTSALLVKGVLWVLRSVEARDERFLRKLMDAKRKMVKDLKDSTRFDKTAALIKKYDPDEQLSIPRVSTGAPAPAGPAEGLRHRSGTAASSNDGRALTASQPTRAGLAASSSMLMRPAAAAASAAVSVAAETGKALMPMFESLANNLVGDNPMLIQEAHQLREENTALRARVAELEAKLTQAPGEEEPVEPIAQGQVASSG